MLADRARGTLIRVSVVLKYWVATQFSDLDEDMIAKVYNFVDNTLKNDGYEELAAMLKKEITTKALALFFFFLFFLVPSAAADCTLALTKTSTD